MLNPRDISSIIINVIFVASFLTVFFFTYVAKVEETVVIGQIEYLVKRFTGDMKLLPDNILANLKSVVANMKKPNTDKADAEVEEINKKIMKKALTYVACDLAVGLFGVHWASKKWGFDFMNIIKENLIILGFVGLTEYSFLTFFGAKFMSADPNKIKLAVVNKLSSIQ